MTPGLRSTIVCSATDFNAGARTRHGEEADTDGDGLMGGWHHGSVDCPLGTGHALPATAEVRSAGLAETRLIRRGERMSYVSNRLNGRPRMLVVVSAMLALGLFMAGPAWAQKAGTGDATGSGEETGFVEGEDFGTEELPFCLEVEESEYQIDFDGVFSAVEAPDPPVVYAGPATMAVTTQETYFASPEGTYGEASMADGCNPATYGPADPIAVDVTVTSPNFAAGDGIQCSGEGSYFRVTNAFTVEWTGQCEVRQGGELAQTGDLTQHLVEAEFVPCFEGMTPPGCTESTLQGAVWTYEGAGT